MTGWRENWRLYHIRCEIRSEIDGIGNVTSYWVSSWDSWLLLSYLSRILRVLFLVAKIVRLVMPVLMIICGFVQWWELCQTSASRGKLRDTPTLRAPGISCNDGIIQDLKNRYWPWWVAVLGLEGQLNNPTSCGDFSVEQVCSLTHGRKLGQKLT